MNYTNNYNLYKPSYDDDVDVQILNQNMDILDGKLFDINKKFNQYLPLTGGKMSGNIELPYRDDIGLSGPNNIGWLRFFESSFKNVKSPTIGLYSKRFKVSTDDSIKEFVVDDTGVWFEGNRIIQELASDVRSTTGYVKNSNGVIMQWGYVNAGSYDGNVQHVTFMTPMVEAKYLVFTSKSNYTSGYPSVLGGEYYAATCNYTSTGFDIICDSDDTSEFWFWFAIGGK